MIGILRRRVMGGVAMSDIDILKSLGCLMWFPLTNEYQNSDVMNSGALCNISGYDANWGRINYGMYTPMGANGVMFAESDFVNGNYTLFITAKKNMNSGKFTINARLSSSSSGTGGTAIGGAYDISGSNNVGNFETKHTGITVRIKNGNIRKRYSDGILIDETEATLPDIWDYDYLRFVSETNNSRYYIRNLLLFNKALTSDEITTVLSIIEK